MSGGAGRGGAVELCFTYTEDEYVSAARLYMSRARHGRFNLFLVLAVLVGTLLVAALAGDPYLGGIVLFCCLAGLALRLYGERAGLRAQVRRDPRFRDPYEVTFAEEGIRLASKGFESWLNWDFYTKVLETPDFFFFVYGEGLFLLIPKRVLREGRQESLLREMARRKLGARAEVEGLPEARGYEPPAEPPDWR